MPKIIYAVIDTEGHEPCVLMGMGLQHKENRERFSAFQLELGGTWGATDPRHPEGSMTQSEVVSFLQGRGYETYMIGEPGLLPITATDLNNPIMQDDEDHGPFVQGNMIAIHPVHADQEVIKLVRARTLTPT